MPDLSDDALIASASVWLRPYAAGVRSKSDLQKLDWQVGLGERSRSAGGATGAWSTESME